MHTWSEFVTEVKTFMPVEAQRHGTEVLVDQLIRSGAINLMRLIPRYRLRYELHFPTIAGDAVGNATYGIIPNLPAHTFVEGVVYEPLEDPVGAAVDPSAMQEVKHTLNWVRWEDRDRIARGELCYSLSIDPHSRAFIVNPPLASDLRMVFWIAQDGEAYKNQTPISSEFTALDFQAAEAVASYALAKIGLGTDKDIMLKREHEADFKNLRRLLMVDRGSFVSEQGYQLLQLQPVDAAAALFHDGSTVLNHLGQPMYFTIASNDE